MTEITLAAQALEIATEAGAATYAPLELRYAAEQLEQARQALGRDDEKQARQLLEESAVNSDLALAKSRLGRTREAVQAKLVEVTRLRSELGLPAEPAQ
ncbi:DUF4398 domain-containing protein [Tahibacter amnicola]|uniref:DUF4398 domain-containing protein n=1 Tax=Tahibacter amnicola TaxID=2976241 RepID=A0ABY6BLE6_9GAMM|nr:DUF4398 domain-containing protein [Tahibacter amnicola]UXI69205.1 DUF4398 domain-containing protein [Tahibacter amnicola]